MSRPRGSIPVVGQTGLTDSQAPNTEERDAVNSPEATPLPHPKISHEAHVLERDRACLS